MIEKICDKLLVFGDGAIRRFETGYREYAERSGQDETESRPAASSEPASAQTFPKFAKQQLKRQREEELMLVTTRISLLLGEIGLLKPAEARYLELDRELAELLAKKKAFARASENTFLREQLGELSDEFQVPGFRRLQQAEQAQQQRDARRHQHQLLLRAAA